MPQRSRLFNGSCAAITARANAHGVLDRVPPPVLLMGCTGIAGVGLFWLSFASGIAATLTTVRNRQLLSKARHDTRAGQMKRRERTRHLTELGGFVVKAGIVELADDDRAAILAFISKGGQLFAAAPLQ